MKTVVIGMLLVMFLALGVMALPASADVNAGLAPVAVYTLGIGDKPAESLAGVSLGLHVIPTSATNKTQAWVSDHVTLEFLCVGGTFDTLKLNPGIALNTISKENISLKAGVAYIFERKDVGVFVGINFPL